MVNRDSAVLWLGITVGVLGYLANAGNPAQWDYNQWIQAAMAVLAIVSAKLGTSPLKGENDAAKVNRRKMGAWLLPLVLTGAMLGTGCASMGGTVTPNPTVDQVQAVRDTAGPIADAIGAAAKLVVEAGRTADQMQQSGLITVAQRQAVDRAIIALEGKAVPVIEIAKTVTTYPQLTATLTALRDAIEPLLQALSAAHPSLASTVDGLRTAYRLVYAYLAGGAR